MSALSKLILALALTCSVCVHILFISYSAKEADKTTTHITPRNRNNTNSSDNPTRNNRPGHNKKHTNISTLSNLPEVKPQKMSKENTMSILNQSPFFTDKYSPAYVIEKYKLIWFLTPKAASTSVLDLLYKLTHPNANSIPNRKGGVRQKIPRFNEYTLDEASDMVLDPQWAKVLIVRDPKARFLSAYLGKEVRRRNFIKPEHRRPNPPYTGTFRHMCCKDKYLNHTSSVIQNSSQPDCWEHNFTFVEFINVTKGCDNIHWRPHVDIVANHTEFLNFIIDFNYLAEDAERLLKKVGAWLKFGATGWGENGTNAVFGRNEHHSSSGSGTYYDYYTPELEKIVEERYRLDYDLLKKRHVG